MEDRTLGQALRAAREVAGLSLRQLAKLADVPHATIARLERDEVEQPVPTYIQRLADVLEIDATELFALIGLQFNMPNPRAYFRKAYGLSEEQAREAEQMIAERFGQNTRQSDEQ